MLTSDATMAYFDPDNETELTTDASPVGLSAILSQKTPGRKDRKVVAYASRSLSDVEHRLRKRLLPSYGQLGDCTSTSTESLLPSSPTASQFS